MSAAAAAAALTYENFPYAPATQAEADALNAAFANMDADTAAYVADALGAAIAAGMNPRDAAGYMSALLGPDRSLMIARTEMLGAYRGAALNTYRDNSDVVGSWMWSAAAGCCVACAEEDGTIHGLDEELDGETHVCCRCTPIPITNPWSDILGPLGIDVSDTAETSVLDDYVPMSEKFWHLPLEDQAAMLGSRSAAEAVAQGLLDPSDFVGHVEEGEYAGAIYTKSLREALADARGMSADEIAATKRDLLAAVRGAASSPQREVERAFQAAMDRVEAARATLDDLSARLGARPRTDFVSRQEMHQAQVDYLTARQQLERAAAAAGKTPEEVNALLQELEGFAAREPTSASAAADKQLVKLQTQRAKYVTQRDAAQARLDRLSEQWIQLVLRTGEFDSEDDEEEIAALERQIAAVEEQQAAQLAKLEKLDQQIAGMDSRLAEAHMPPSERVQMLRRQVDESMAQREMLYAQQHDLLSEKATLENSLQNANGLIGGAQRRAMIDLYHQTLDATDPNVKAYLKALRDREKFNAARDAAQAEQRRLQDVLDRLSLAGKQQSAEYAQAKADYDAAAQAYEKANKAADRAYGKLWDSARHVYAPELDSIAGFEARYTTTTFGTDANGFFRTFRETKYPWTMEQVANHPFVLAERERIAQMGAQIRDIEAQVKSLDKPIKDINKEIEAHLAQLRELNATLRAEGEIADPLRPFSDVIDLPPGHQPPNETMQKLDYREREPRAVTKRRIIDDITTRLQDNPVWQDYVARAPSPDLGRLYHGYIPEYASARDTKSAQLVADWVKKWGIGYRPGSPEWVAMQMASRDEFGLDAAIHAVTDAQVRAGEAYYAQNGPAIRVLMRAMYDNTQQWFADHGITELDLYRGYGWSERSSAVPNGIHWGTIDKQNTGITDLELNPFQSFSADINISQGTGAGNGFAGGGFGGGDDYSLLIGARVPVERVLSTAQTGFGAKRESEIVVMGRNLDTVAYRAGTRVKAALLREADEQVVGDGRILYALEDGTKVDVLANPGGTFTLTYQDGPEGKLGTLKIGSSKTYKSEKSINNALKAMRISNTYVAPADETLAAREGEDAAAASAAARASVRDGLTARIDNIPANATVADMQDYVMAHLPGLQSAQLGMPGDINLMNLDAPTARLVANATVNLLEQLPEIADNIWRIAVENTYTDAIAFVPRDGLSLILNTDKWTDLADMAVRFPQYYADGWWVSQTPEDVIGHEIGHMLQLNYHITNDTWVEAMERVAAAGGNPLVSQYAGDKVEESFAETFALLVYGQPTDAQLPIVREMAHLLKSEGIDYDRLREAVGMAPLDLGSA